MLEQSHFLLELRSYLIEHWNDYGLEGTPAGLTYRMRQTQLGRSDRNRMVALWFHDNPEKPELVTKWGTTPNSGAFTQQEHRHARWLYEQKNLRFIPKPIDCPTLSDIPVRIEEAVVGRSFAHRLLRLPEGRELELKRAFSKAKEILENIQDPLHAVTMSEFFIRFELYLSRAETILGWNKAETEKIKSIIREKMMNPVAGSGKTLLAGDFAPQNLIESEKGIFLIDLEFSLESVMAFLDPLTFVYRIFRMLSPDLSRKEPPEAVQTFESYLTDKENPFGTLSASFLESRGLSKTYFDWYWMIFFIHEAIFQHFILEHFSTQDAAYFNAFISHFSKETVVGVAEKQRR